MRKYFGSMTHALPLLILLCMGFVVSAGLPGCKSVHFASRWRTVPVMVDGKNTEWENALVKFEERQAMVGFMNDGTDLYIAVVTDDRGLQRQMMFRGLTVWFDREGGSEKRFGIHYPRGMQFGAFGMNRPPRDAEGADSSFRDRMPPVDTTQIEIFGPGENDHQLLQMAQLKRLAAKISLSGGLLVYELKVPLTDDGPEPFAIGTSPGKTIGVGFETAARVVPQDGGEGAGGGEGATRGGMGRRGGRRGGGFGGGEGEARQRVNVEPLSVWATVDLAAGPASPNQ
jgi:hypothetical protein